MAKKRTSKKTVIQNYQIAKEALKTPRRYLHNGQWLGIGGEIVIPDQPPKLGYKIPEATPEQYLEIGKVSTLVKIIEI